MNRQTAIEFLQNTPYLFGHMLGFKDLTTLHNEWLLSMYNAKEDMTLQAHRGSYKTTDDSLYIVIEMITHPKKRIMFMRKTDTDVKEIISQVKKILLSDVTQAFVKKIYDTKLVLSQDNATQISTNLSKDVKGTPQLWACGIGSSITGKHFDIIITDDIVNQNDRVSRAEREKTKLIYQELQNVKNVGGKIINTGTPWHKDDCFSIMPAPQKFDCYSTGLLSKEEIEELKSKMTASLFSANYELKHIADDDVIFSSPKTGESIELIKNGTSHCDAAFYGEDYTAFTIVAIHNGNYYVFGKCWRKHIDDVMDEIVKYHNDNLCQKLYIEKNADKGYVAKAFREKGIKVVSYNEHQNKYVKITTHLKFVWDKVYFVEGTDTEYIDMICDYNENAEHDDACLVGDTLIATTKGNVKIKDIKKGDYVLTPMGARKVIDCGMTAKNVDVYNYNGVIATPNHKFYDKTNNKFIRADSLVNTTRCDIISLKELIIWKRRLLYLMGLNIGEAQRANIISSMQQEIAREKMQNNYTDPCGNIIMEKFRKDIIFIILTVISTITTFPIWSAYRLRNIYQCTQRKILKMKKQERQNKNIVQINANANFIEKANVYNLTVENAGCFYANGILVSNCDSLSSLIRVIAKKGQREPNANSLFY